MKLKRKVEIQQELMDSLKRDVYRFRTACVHLVQIDDERYLDVREEAMIALQNMESAPFRKDEIKWK